MPTYRILDQDGVIVDKDREPPSISDEEVIRMYKDMVTVSIMDIIMFDAQRQGRISFYMVCPMPLLCPIHPPYTYSLRQRFPLAKKA